tara:strand:+ start:4306 stop:5394 length:1089 start_codon:yes stop_codon:yes gene_type:complete
MINLYEPKIYNEDIQLVLETLEKGWLSGNTPIIQEFEEKISNYLGNKYSLLCSNGTVALHLALLSLGIEKDDEVIIPSLSYIASANAVSYIGAKPVFVDVNLDDWQMDETKIEEKVNSKTKAIMPVHLFGLTPNLEKIDKIAKKHSLFVVHDSAEALGTKYKERHSSSYSDVGIHSFFPNKVITTGEGGLLTTNDAKIYNLAKKLRSQGLKGSVEYEHDVVGFNYRMPAICAALGLNQIDKIDEHVQMKKILFDKFKKNLEDYGYIFPVEKNDVESSYWLISCLIPEEIDRSELKKHLFNKGIDTRNVFKPINEQQPYLTNDILYLNSSKIGKKGICLPSSPGLKQEDSDFIIDEILKFSKK